LDRALAALDEASLDAFPAMNEVVDADLAFIADGPAAGNAIADGVLVGMDGAVHGDHIDGTMGI
jgi:hypothetical protein